MKIPPSPFTSVVQSVELCLTKGAVEKGRASQTGERGNNSWRSRTQYHCVRCTDSAGNRGPAAAASAASAYIVCARDTGSISMAGSACSSATLVTCVSVAPGAATRNIADAEETSVARPIDSVYTVYRLSQLRDPSASASDASRERIASVIGHDRLVAARRIVYPGETGTRRRLIAGRRVSEREREKKPREAGGEAERRSSRSSTPIKRFQVSREGSGYTRRVDKIAPAAARRFDRYFQRAPRMGESSSRTFESQLDSGNRKSAHS